MQAPTPRGLPWQDLMAVAFGRLGLSPDTFWNMTLPELNAALDGAFGQTRTTIATRAALRNLMSQFPDEKGSKDNG